MLTEETFCQRRAHQLRWLRADDGRSPVATEMTVR